MKSMNELFSELQKNIDREYTNSKLIKKISDEFMVKNLDMKIANYLYNESYSIMDLTTNELMAICTVLYREGFEIFKPSNFFSASDLINYESIIKEVNESLDKLIFKNVTKCDNRTTFLCPFVPAKDIYSFLKNNLIRYNFQTQRNAKIATINNSTVIKEININKKSVKEIKDLFISGKAAISTIYLNLYTLDNKEPIINFDEKTKELAIVPESNIEDQHFLVVDSIDGWHRTQAITDAYAECLEKGIELDAYLNVQIENYSVEQARDFIFQMEKRNKINEDYAKSLENNDFTKVARTLLTFKQNNTLYGKVSLEWNEMLAKGDYTTISILSTALKEAGLSDNAFRQKKETDKLLEMLGLIVDMISEYEFKGNKHRFLRSEYNKPWSWALYIQLCFGVMDKVDYFDILDKMINVLISNTEKMNNLKLGTKNVSIKKIKEFANSIISEV